MSLNGHADPSKGENGVNTTPAVVEDVQAGPSALPAFDDQCHIPEAAVAKGEGTKPTDTTEATPVSHKLSMNVSSATPFSPGPDNKPDPFAGKSIYDFQVLDCLHELYDLCQHKGKVVLICNVATKSKEYSEQGYRRLTTLYRRYGSKGFTVLAFPCNQFGGCEPGNEDEIAEQVSCLFTDIGEVEFPIMSKIDVNGDSELPLYTFMKSRVKGSVGQSAVKWNFTYFLIDREGMPILRFAPDVSMNEMEELIVEVLDGVRCLDQDPGSPCAPPKGRTRTREPSIEEFNSGANGSFGAPPAPLPDIDSSVFRSPSPNRLAETATPENPISLPDSGSLDGEEHT